MSEPAPRPAGAALLEARGLAVAPPGAARAAIENVSLELAAGEWLAISGPNGGGKSTLAMALAGLWPAAAGEVRLRGAPLSPGDPAPRRQIAVVFQDPASQILQGTVRDELAFAARNLDRPEAWIERQVARVALELGLAGELARDPRQLSAGRQQLVLLGAALVSAPALLVADEPGAHLDPGARSLALAAVRGRVAEGLAVVWVTQDDQERAAADRVIEVGERHAQGPAVLRPPAGAPGEPLLEVHIGAPPEAGPAIRIAGLGRMTVPGCGVTAITGPNGSGKTLLISAMAGLFETGQVRLEWRRTPEMPPIIATQYPEMQIFEERVEDEVLHAARSRGGTGSELQIALRQWLDGVVPDPAEFLRRRCWTLSAGERRLVGILGALLAPAPLVLLDEPTAGLDAALRRAVAGMVVARSAGTPVVVATQDPDWARSLGAAVHGSTRWSNSPSRSQKTD